MKMKGTRARTRPYRKETDVREMIYSISLYIYIYGAFSLFPLDETRTTAAKAAVNSVIAPLSRSSENRQNCFITGAFGLLPIFRAHACIALARGPGGRADGRVGRLSVPHILVSALIVRNSRRCCATAARMYTSCIARSHPRSLAISASVSSSGEEDARESIYRSNLPIRAFVYLIYNFLNRSTRHSVYILQFREQFVTTKGVFFFTEFFVS